MQICSLHSFFRLPHHERVRENEVEMIDGRIYCHEFNADENGFRLHCDAEILVN